MIVATPSPSAAPAARKTKVSQMRTSLIQEIADLFEIIQPRTMIWSLLVILTAIVNRYGNNVDRLEHFESMLEDIDRCEISSIGEFVTALALVPGDGIILDDTVVNEMSSKDPAIRLELKIMAKTDEVDPGRAKMFEKLLDFSANYADAGANHAFAERLYARIAAGEFESFGHFAAKGLPEHVRDGESRNAANEWSRCEEATYQAHLALKTQAQRDHRQYRKVEDVIVVDSGSNGDGDPGHRARV